VSIARFALRERPHPQAMVTVRNDSASGRAVLKIETSGKTVERELGLPTRGTEQNFFIDLDAAGPTARASLDVQDDLDVDNVACLAREHDWPKIEIRGSIPPAIQRVVAAYQRARPAGEGGAKVAITSSPQSLRNDETGVIIGTSSLPAIDIRSHPLGANIDWSRLT